MQSQPTLSDCSNSFCFQPPSVIQNCLSAGKYPGEAWMKPKVQGTCTQSYLMHYCIQSHQLGEVANTFPLLKNLNPEKGDSSCNKGTLTMYSTLPKTKTCRLHLGLKSEEENEILPIQVDRHGKVI